ncbi:hypothetical protein TNCT_262451 [Trichonephila clavata]|uniref:Uncharacterized protein n=1 Tax=Trichonephila clavata TaxID=2740835 RepID=A0A8X6FJ31_TRICU|nr:hypothetical protein TNCT_262451 [Trichonephila clavata]
MSVDVTRRFKTVLSTLFSKAGMVVHSVDSEQNCSLWFGSSSRRPCNSLGWYGFRCSWCIRRCNDVLGIPTRDSCYMNFFGLFTNVRATFIPFSCVNVVHGRPDSGALTTELVVSNLSLMRKDLMAQANKIHFPISYAWSLHFLLKDLPMMLLSQISSHDLR